MKKILLPATLVILAVGFFVYYGGFNKDIQKKDKVIAGKKLIQTTITFPTSVESLFILNDFIKDNGFYEKNGLDVVFVDGGKNVAQLFLSGGSKFFLGGVSSTSLAYLNGFDTRLLGDIGKVSNIYFLSKFPINETQSIKRVVVPGKNTIAGNVAKLFLEKMNVDSEKAEYPEMKLASDRVAVFLSEQADAGIFQSYSEIRELINSGKYYVFGLDMLQTDFSNDKYLTTTKDVIEKEPETARKMVTSYKEGIEFMKSNPEKVEQYLQEKYKYSREESTDMYKSLMLSQENLDFIPNMERVSFAVEEAKKEVDLKADRNLNDFIFSDFAK